MTYLRPVLVYDNSFAKCKKDQIDKGNAKKVKKEDEWGIGERMKQARRR